MVHALCLVRRRPGTPTFVLSVGEQLQYILDNTSTVINSDSCICCSQTLESKRFRSEPEHVPSWRKKEENAIIITCDHPQCKESSETSKMISPSEETKNHSL